MNFNHTTLSRFLDYVKIDTQSDPASLSVPSTEKQKNLGRVLVKELHDMGLTDAHLDEFGYVYATLPANTDKQNVPVLCFCSHMDTSPDCSGTNVKPLVHQAWNGADIVLPDDPTQIIRMSEHPDLKAQIGNDIVTASGTTLLGADNKAGVAAIMDAVFQLVSDPKLKHGTLRILFTPDEEIGRGADEANMEKLGAQFGYTVDGESLGSIENETFSADGVVLKIFGVPSHPGYAQGSMENAIKIAADIVAQLPRTRLSPETTRQKKGFIHPTKIEGILDEAALHFIIRDFDDNNLAKHEKELLDIVVRVMKNYPKSRFTFKVSEQYRNMKQILDKHPEVAEYAVEAVKRAGIEPILGSIRGGTDGSRFSFMGLPCPNIFAGEHAFHSRLEWVSVQDMNKSAETIIHLCQIWEERSE